MWELETARVVHTLKGHTSKVKSIAFSPDGRFIVSGGSGKSLVVYERDDSANQDSIPSYPVYWVVYRGLTACEVIFEDAKLSPQTRDLLVFKKN